MARLLRAGHAVDYNTRLGRAYRQRCREFAEAVGQDFDNGIDAIGRALCQMAAWASIMAGAYEAEGVGRNRSDPRPADEDRHSRHSGRLLAVLAQLERRYQRRIPGELIGEEFEPLVVTGSGDGE